MRVEVPDRALEEGKRQSARNALRHGLSSSVLRDPYLSDEVRVLAHQIAGSHQHLFDLATEIAEAQVSLQRVRQIRAELMNRALRDPRTGAHPKRSERSGLLAAF